MTKSPTVSLRGISSMATKALLHALSRQFLADTGIQVSIESVGGVDAAKRVEGGESFDMVFLAADAIERLQANGHLQTGSRCDWVRSSVAVAVPVGAPQPHIDTEEQLKAVVNAAGKLSYSTGPSGNYLATLFERWGMLDTLRPRIVVPPPGVPVAKLLAEHQVDLGFQQRSELLHQPGVCVLGDLPPEVAYMTVFSAGAGSAAAHDAVRLQAVMDFFEFISADKQRACKQSFGMS